MALGEVAAFAELYDRYADSVFRTAFRRTGDRQIAEEILQDTYMALWNRAALFDPQQGSLLAWLSTIARNRAVDRLRHAGRRPAVAPLSAVMGEDDADDRTGERRLGLGDLVGSGSRSVDPARIAEDADLRAEVLAALEAMPQPEREVIHLAYYADLTQVEIAQRLGWPLGTVKTRTRRGLARLRGTLGQRLIADREHSDAAGQRVSIPLRANPARDKGRILSVREVTDGPR